MRAKERERAASTPSKPNTSAYNDKGDDRDATTKVNKDGKSQEGDAPGITWTMARHHGEVLESREPGINLSGSWQRRHSTAYNTPLRKQSRLQGIPPGQSPRLNRGQGRRRTHTPSYSPDARQENARNGHAGTNLSTLDCHRPRRTRRCLPERMPT